ncbi:hypothetical protein H8E07_20235 [bacterium]|nr:hypothetical protein [bacterium]
MPVTFPPRVPAPHSATPPAPPEVRPLRLLGGPAGALPPTSPRRADTHVRVRDGETIYLGGLLSEETRKDVKKLPILGDIPLLGYLFSHTRTEKVRLDLLIEITPRIVGDSGSELPSGAEENPELSYDTAPADGAEFLASVANETNESTRRH